MPLYFEAGKAALFLVMPRVDPKTGRLFDLEYDQVYMDPVTAEEVGRRKWGKPGLDRQHFVAFLYKLHYTLHIPEMLGVDRWGYWLMGGVALIWMVDCFVGFYLTLPSRAGRAAAATLRRTWWQRWRLAWTLRRDAGWRRLNFDLHRALGLWFWVVLLIIAFTAASQNLFLELFRPALKLTSTITPCTYDVLKQQPLHQPVISVLSFKQVAEIAKADAVRRGWQEPAARVFYDQRYGYYSVSFYFPGEGCGTGGMGMKRTLFDASDGRLIGERIPWHGTAADVFMQMQFPVHSGRIFGLPGRILMSIMGLVVAGLAATGIAIWYRNWRAREAARRGQSAPSPVSPGPAE